MSSPLDQLLPGSPAHFNAWCEGSPKPEQLQQATFSQQQMMQLAALQMNVCQPREKSDYELALEELDKEFPTPPEVLELLQQRRRSGGGGGGGSSWIYVITRPQGDQ